MRRKGRPPIWPGLPYDIIILDEIQDCTEILFWLVCSLTIAMTRAANGMAPRLVILGDERQAIYSFRQADARHLTHASDAMQALTPYRWKYKTLSKSFRLSIQTAKFINHVFLQQPNHIEGSHSHQKPIYLHANPRDMSVMEDKLLPLIKEYGPRNTAILAPSVKSATPIAKFTNRLSSRYHIPIASPLSDDVPLDNRLTHDKLPFTSLKSTSVILLSSMEWTTVTFDFLLGATIREHVLTRSTWRFLALQSSLW
jgi:hypothetical protein